MDTAGGYEPPRNQTIEEKITEWEAQAAAILGIDKKEHNQLYADLLIIFDAKNFTDSSGQQALRDIERLKDLRQDPAYIILFLKDKFKYYYDT